MFEQFLCHFKDALLFAFQVFGDVEIVMLWFFVVWSLLVE